MDVAQRQDWRYREYKIVLLSGVNPGDSNTYLPSLRELR